LDPSYKELVREVRDVFPIFSQIVHCPIFTAQIQKGGSVANHTSTMTQTNVRALFREFQAVNEDRKGIYENQAQIVFPNEDDPFNVVVVLKPKYGYFKGGTISFKMVPHLRFASTHTCNAASVAHSPIFNL
jgi:hypothetical protein